MVNMLSKKELFKKRWLYYLGLVFFWIIPIAMVLEKTITIENKGKSVSVSAIGFILGLIYLVAFRKKVKTYLQKKDFGFTQKFLLCLSEIVPFAVVACIVYLVMNALKGFDMTMWLVCASMVIGSLMMAIEHEINKILLYELELWKEAKRDVDKDSMKERYKKKLKELKGDI